MIITSLKPHGLITGDIVHFTPHRRWWVHLWRWITLKKNVWVVTKISDTVFTYEREKSWISFKKHLRD